MTMSLFSRIFHSRGFHSPDSSKAAPQPKVSVCIPVYNTERLLARCLQSFVNQDLAEKEAVVVVDASPGCDDEGRSAAEICKAILRNPDTGKPLDYIILEHNKNLGILETRRDAVYRAHGEYIFVMDSDDYLEGNDCLSSLYAMAKEQDADIVNSTGIVFSDETDEATAKQRDFLIQRMQGRLNACQTGLLEGSDILEGYLVAKNHCGYLWGKLFRRELFVRALEQIPFTLCTMAEDYIFYFFMTLFARRYWGTDRRWYKYGIDTGVSSHKKIDTMDRWIRVCSAASVFAVISEYLAEPDNVAGTDGSHAPISPQVINSIKGTCNFFVRNNLEQLEEQVVPELQDQAYATLGEFWGEDYVRTIQDLMEAERGASASGDV